MLDDIVTRLRERHNQAANYPRLLLSEIEALNEAADEIERLRKEVTRWKDLAADLAMELAMTELAVSDES
jgi:hypothetical protein